MITKELEKLGLSSGEAKVYISALELGESTITRIAQKAQMKRTTVHSITSSLLQRGLMSASKNRKRNVYEAINPRKLKEDLASRERTIDQILPELLAITNVIDRKPTIKFYEGIEGIKEAHQHTLEFKGYEMLFWVSDVPITDESADYWFNVYQPKRIGNKIKMRAIAPQSPHMKRFLDEDALAIRETRLDKNDHFKIKADIILYKNRYVLISSFKEMLAIFIESEFIHDTFKAIFESHWQSLDPKTK